MSDRPKALIEAQNRALRKENERLQRYAERYFELLLRYPEVVREAQGVGEDGGEA
ncbi:hypothetical protein [Halorientalis halophila]|uniref:hypothetical protein n=1 Tax=Halorientalis halophila TaxID=3108499 RepID=UPI003009A373